MFAVMAEIVLAFIGVSGTSDWNWGTILYSAQSQQALAQGAWWWFAPAGLAVALLGTALALVNFGIDELINPRLRAGARSRVRTASGQQERMRAGFTPVVSRTPAEAPATSDVILRVENFTVEYGIGPAAVPAVRDVSLTLRRGEILGLAGESGSGKSSLAYGLTRLLPPPGIVRGGSVRYHPAGDPDPVDILAMSPAELRAFRWEQIAIVFQSALSALNPVYKIATQLMDVLSAHRPGMPAPDRRDRATELLRMVGIPTDRLDSYPHELSGGMRQRVLIGMALALEPKIIILDEPTTALDMVTQRQILSQLLSLQQQVGFSIVFITHDLGLLVEFADRIAVMYAGRIVEQAPVAALHREPLHPYSHGLISSFPPLHGQRRELRGIPGSPADLRTASVGCAFEPRCPKAFAPCSDRRPELGVPDSEEPDRSVACWLHQAGDPDG
jgi:oligopeptide/dipeptide ABC transporter ATP-binding protein